MGRDKKNPKPLDINAFHTLVKTASEVLRRHEQQLYAQLHKSVRVGELTVRLDIEPDADNPSAMLSAVDAFGEEIASVRVRPDFKLSTSSAAAWIEGGFGRP
jgi:hypothetical protein